MTCTEIKLANFILTLLILYMIFGESNIFSAEVLQMVFSLTEQCINQ